MSQTYLFSVCLFPNSRSPYFEEDRLEGKVICREGKYYLDVEEPRIPGPVEMKLKFIRKIEPFFALMAQNETVLELKGTRNGYWMDISGISGANKDILRSRLSDDMYLWLLRCLLGTVDEKSRYLIRRADEAETWLQVMEASVPEWVRRAVRKNMQLQRGGGNTDSRGHALQALNYLCNINWNPEKPPLPTVREAEEILDREFFGMRMAKTRILEMVAQMNRTGQMPKWGLLLNGPAGVGKSSILKALARILQMPIIQLDISSVGKDVEAISGSSRIFSNAYGGKILSGMYQHGTSRAIVVINELDKCSGEARVADVLLTLVDKLGFYENFLEETIPTEHMFFVASSNELEKISKPMRNRFLTVELPGYSAREKEEIFRRFVLPSAMKTMNIHPEEMSLEDEAVRILVEEYATEPGVRDLEQYAQTLTGDYAMAAALGPVCGTRIYNEKDLRRLFGPSRRITNISAKRPGTATGAFYLDGQARIFEIQATMASGFGECHVKGPFTELQKQFVEVAFECARNSGSFGLEHMDVTIFMRHPIPSNFDNTVGMAAFAAICSMASRSVMDLGNILFVGGCDLYGNIYFEEWDLMPLLKLMKERHIQTLYAPLGTGQLMEQVSGFDGSITIIEAPDAMTLFSLAAMQSKKAG